MQDNFAGQSPRGLDSNEAASRRSFKVSDPLNMTRLRIDSKRKQNPPTPNRSAIVNSESHSSAPHSPSRKKPTRAAQFESYTGWLQQQTADPSNSLPLTPIEDDANRIIAARLQQAAVIVDPSLTTAEEFDPVHYTTTWQTAVARAAEVESAPVEQDTIFRPAQKVIVNRAINVQKNTTSVHADSITTEPTNTNPVRTESLNVDPNTKKGVKIRIDSTAHGITTHGITTRIAEINRRAASASQHSVQSSVSRIAAEKASGQANGDFSVPSASRGFSVNGLVRIDAGHDAKVRKPNYVTLRESIKPQIEKPAVVGTVADSTSNHSATSSGISSTSPGPIDSSIVVNDMSGGSIGATSDAGSPIIERDGPVGTQPVSSGYSGPSIAPKVSGFGTKPSTFAGGGAPHDFSPTEWSNDSDANARHDSSGTEQLPVSLVSWEVDDFSWPGLVDSMAASTGSAGLVNAAMQILTPEKNRLIVTSAERGSGTSTIAAVLAKSLAAAGKSVLLIDSDLGGPDLSRQLGLPLNYSWLNVINAKREEGDAIVRSIRTGVCVMPMVRVLSRVAWPRFFFDTLSPLVEKVRSGFDAVIIDVGPADQLTTELSSAERLADAALIVNRISRPELADTSQICDSLTEFGIGKIVIAENFAQPISK